MRCVAIDVAGAVVDVVPQPVDVSTCLLVLGSPSELVGPLDDFLSMSMADGALISAAIAACWVIGWAVRMACGMAGARHD